MCRRPRFTLRHGERIMLASGRADEGVLDHGRAYAGLTARVDVQADSAARVRVGHAALMVSFSVQASPADTDGWLRLAARCEAAGFDALLVADHPGSDASAFVALAAAAAVTSTIGLGSYVSNAAVREPILLATDVATLDVVSNGRARLGIGAGHTPAEWHAIGRQRPDVGAVCAAVWRSPGLFGRCLMGRR
jgi:hypothetical protein